MAQNGSFNTNAYSSRSLLFSWAVKSQSIANNTTTITWSLTGAGGSTGAYYYTQNITVKINNQTVYSYPLSSGQVKLYNGTQVASGTFTISHNSTGEAALSASVEAGIYDWSPNVRGSGSWQLPKIARQSTLTVSDGTLGVEQTISVTRQDSSMSHTIKYTAGKKSGTIVSNSTGTAVKWTPPVDLATENTTGTTVSVVLTITTFSNGSSIGSTDYPVKLAIPQSVAPVLSLEITDPSGSFARYGAYVRGNSSMEIKATASGSYGSTIQSYRIEADGKTYTQDTANTGVISTPGNIQIKATVTDSRGRAANEVRTVTVLDYAFPRISGLEASRCAEDGTPSTTGGFLRVAFGASVTPLNALNSAVYTLRYKQTSGDDWEELELSSYAGAHSVTDGAVIFPASTNASYDIELTVEDDFKIVRKTTYGSSVRQVWSLLKRGGKIAGLAFGKVADLAGTLDVDWVIRARRGIIVDSPWVDLTIGGNFAPYGNDVNNSPRAKMTGNVVTIHGSLTPKTAFTSNYDDVVIVSGIPEEMRPLINVRFYCQGTDTNHWLCTVHSNGNISCSRYTSGAASQTVQPGWWLPFCITYQV